MHEAAEFAVHLKRCEKDIRTLKNATEGEASAQSGTSHLRDALQLARAVPRRSSTPDRCPDMAP